MLTHTDAGIQAVFTQLERQRDEALAALSNMGSTVTALQAQVDSLNESLAAAMKAQTPLATVIDVQPDKAA